MNNYIYARSAKQSPKAINAQVKECMKYANEKGLLIDEVFIDDGFSGLSKNRPGFNKLLNTAKKGDTVIVSTVYKLSRDIFTLHLLIGAMRYNFVFLDHLDFSIDEDSKVFELYYSFWWQEWLKRKGSRGKGISK
ncbi:MULTISPECIES: recombinase family protein [Paenibacillus]|uniref:DNA invertase Pin-like site-specific DNA recombinase n=1 Tax=Paenibacillus turicensis TaxID=160487 RepID=A0ABS4FQW4_9BACL|nr:MULTISPECIES: recombinase family protein [Paenibacillus]MBP1904965.1 DNA invertase Pin-like site-specific DNA recombinase [Paenibacillus turicensis]